MKLKRKNYWSNNNLPFHYQQALRILMKFLIYIPVLLFWSCKNANTKNDAELINIKDSVKAVPATNNKRDTLLRSRDDRIKYHALKDSVVIYCANKDTLRYSKQEFNDIVDNFPELTDSRTQSPDDTYGKSEIWVDLVDSLGNKDRRSFSSECGQDEYYALYAYFLKNKNGIARYSVRRNNLIKIYDDLNSLFGELNYGGTYYGHQYSRIEGYAEFAVYWYNHYSDYFDRPYDISKQKAIYIAGLKQLIRDEVAIDVYVAKKDKQARIEELSGTVDHLGRLITDNFYLRMAQSFQSDHY